MGLELESAYATDRYGKSQSDYGIPEEQEYLIPSVIGRLLWSLYDCRKNFRCLQSGSMEPGGLNVERIR